MSANPNIPAMYVDWITNGNCAPRRRAGSLTGEKPVRKGLTNHR